MSQAATLRIPPYSMAAEAALLGCLMLDTESLHHIAGVGAEAFHTPNYSLIFSAIQRLAAAGKPIDVISVFEALGSKKDGGIELADLNALAQYVPSMGNLRRYAEIVVDKYRSRCLLKAAAEISDLVFIHNTDANWQIDAAQMKLAKLAEIKSKCDPQHVTQSLPEYLQHMDDLASGKNSAIATGIHGLDALLNGGLRRGEMMVLGGRPKHGKTAVALALARNMSHDFKVLFISQEMPINQLMHRHTAAMGTVELDRILKADARDEDMWWRATEAADRLGKLNLVHDDQSAQSLMDIRRKAMQVKRKYGLDVLFVDFLQLMQGVGNENRNRELDVIANGLKALALDLQIGVILMSQMSRKADETYHHPTMTYLRDSGAIEAAADQIVLLFTDVAHPLSPNKKNPAFEGYSQLEIVAHRNGATGFVPLHFVGKYQQVSDWEGAVPTYTLAKANKPRPL